MKNCLAIAGLIATLAACAPPTVPDSGEGIGFGAPEDFALQQARREAALNGTPLPQPPSVQTQAIPSSDLRAAGIGQNGGGDVGAPLSVTNLAGAAPAPADVNNPGISDENDFSAVASRETIESDAQRRQEQAAVRQVVEPTAIPARPTTTGPNIVAYALNAPNAKGQEWYSRSLLSGQARFQRNCASYNNPDAAQRDFLARGGPERDPRGIDPDGDGFACGWDPAPFLLAAGR
ncbi:hypothetical protein SAMN04488515_1828 [Cognatiyoonia koreensis]|uniref:Excalibur calcium-binding domain-containing protein n=1 Tax=Cognatiyoonia koreensis TaxID=364200 RepID=A0A1I0QCR7_9RHOB|nr:hypothetical protein [Cognatiyoonia koreensis]SEW24847.1 hypothetical protein SAMN04488515_1828 [Cognatiyoonia koreensis]